MAIRKNTTNGQKRKTIKKRKRKEKKNEMEE